nr:acyl-coenzyme A thioesterase 13-like isoform X2 [Malus domestica]
MREESLAPKLEDAKKYLEVTQDELEAVSRLVFPSDRLIYDNFVESGIRVDRVQPGFVVCTFKVPPRLTDRAGNLANGAIATLVDVVGASTVFVPHIPMTVSVDMSISYMAKAKLNDELEITSKRLGQRGRYYGTYVLLRNKASGEIIAEGRHSLFRPSSTSKL